ncbi:hypothetical protein M9H77_03547 [Catharanthus roseus]|uniref:Uncharacterized protein n=1 Tax=Catharanthus roseus TaxID=4058 RepID=A0ACC0CC11_CATRO|nr:hypothetical protein M9H77_03547 [Catharanthus roseus]
MEFEHCPLLSDKKIFVYKLDADFERWVPVENLGNVALFNSVVEGGGLKKNSIYFSDNFVKNGLVNMMRATAMELSTTLEFPIWKKEPNKVHHFDISECEESLPLVLRWIEIFHKVEEYFFLHTITHYQTKKFYVYKLNSDFETRVPAERVGNVALLLGRNESLYLKNSVYFRMIFGKKHPVNMKSRNALELITTVEFSILKMENLSPSFLIPSS